MNLNRMIPKAGAAIVTVKVFLYFTQLTTVKNEQLNEQATILRYTTNHKK